jgi:hypothetical protein
MASAWIFPTTLYGQPSDVYGTNVTQYANTNGFPGGSGLILGNFGLLFDFTALRLFKANAGIAANQACTYVIGNSNDYTVVATSAANTQPVVSTNDRAGATALVANNIAWMTCYGLGTTLVAASITAPAGLTSSATAGQLAAYVAGTSTFNNVLLLNTTTAAGAYPVKFQ